MSNAAEKYDRRYLVDCYQLMCTSIGFHRYQHNFTHVRDFTKQLCCDADRPSRSFSFKKNPHAVETNRSLSQSLLFLLISFAKVSSWHSFLFINESRLIKAVKLSSVTTQFPLSPSTLWFENWFSLSYQLSGLFMFELSQQSFNFSFRVITFPTNVEGFS